MATGQAQAQMNPGSAQSQAFLTALRCAHANRADPPEMRISNFRNHVGSYVAPVVKQASGEARTGHGVGTVQHWEHRTTAGQGTRRRHASAVVAVPDSQSAGSSARASGATGR